MSEQLIKQWRHSADMSHWAARDPGVSMDKVARLNTIAVTLRACANELEDALSRV